MRFRLTGFWATRWGLGILVAALLLLVSAAGTFTYFYVRFSRMIDERLAGPVFSGTSRVFTAPRRIAVGEALSPAELAAYLLRVGYAEADVPGSLGLFRVHSRAVEIRPGPASYFAGRQALRVEFSGNTISRIVEPGTGSSLDSAEIEPELLTALFDSSREKRRLVRYEDLPRVLVLAVLSAEDKRFFEHPGLDPIRVLGAAWRNIWRSDRTEGASTISMQVARSYFFSPERTWRRKLAETLVAFQLEQRFTKEQILELYANQIYLGNRGSFAIRGFGEAAQAYFAKDVRELTLAEAAFLAGIARAPNRYSSAERQLGRANEARDRVLAQMVDNGFVTPAEADAARKAPWRLVRGTLETSSAPYFVDIVKDHLLERFSEADLISSSHRIYTTLDASLQRAAADAVELGIQLIDQQLARRYQRWQRSARKGEPVPQAQVALVALDARTGEIKALIGGRDYGQSQLNRVLARRQPGSVFKPFVYAAAFEDAVIGREPVLTPVSTVEDQPTTFFYEDREYTPNNYGEEYHGTVTLRTALRQSLNVATVKVAESIGYDRVVELARQLGIEARLQPTPAIALGAYEMTPLEVAAAYTVFASGGVRAEPIFLRSVIAADGTVVERNVPRTRPVLDPRVAYLVTHLLQDVVNRGTAAGVRSRGFYAPAAGKTGTSHDGWFAGFTTNLVCVVWVGFDDNRELGLSGAAAAAPIWAEFMKRAIQLPAYRNAANFPPPPGVTFIAVDPSTGQLATSHCPEAVEEVFIAGTEPIEFCHRHGGRMLTSAPPVSWVARVFGARRDQPPPPGAAAEPSSAEPARDSSSTESKSAAASKAAAESAGAASRSDTRSGSPSPKTVQSPPASSRSPQEQKGIFRRLWGIFTGDKEKKEPAKAPPPEKQKSPPAKPDR